MANLNSFGQAAASPIAAAEQLALIACLYQNRHDLAEALLMGSGVIRIWEHQPYTYPPSWCLIEEPGGIYTVCFAGTVADNPRHWAIHASGTVGTIPAWLGGGGVQCEWLRQYQWSIEPTITSRVGTPSRIRFSGHSYGGAIAHIAARDWSERIGSSKVELLTFGQPQTFTDGSKGPWPSSQWRWRSWGDIVAQLPGEEEYPLITNLTNPLTAIAKVQRWRHVGQDVWIAPDGMHPSGGGTPNPLPTGVSMGPLSEHQLRNYWGRLRAWSTNKGSPSAMVNALAIADTALSGPGAQQPTRELPRTVIGTSGEALPFPWYDGVLSSSGGINVSQQVVYPLPISGGRVMQSTLFFSCKDNGWSESYLTHVVTTGDPYEFVKTWVKKLLEIRRKGLSQYANIDFARISDVAIPGDVEPVTEPYELFGAGAVTGESVQPQLGWQLDTYDGTRVFRSRRCIRGFHQDWLRNSMNFGYRGGPGTKKPETFFAELGGFITKPFGTNFTGTITPCVRVLNRDPASHTKATIAAFDVSPQGYLKVILDDAAPGYVQGSTVNVKHKRTPNVKGINGRHTIASHETIGGVSHITMTDKPRCPVAGLYGVSGLLIVKPVVYLPVTNYKVTRATSRNTGAPFVGSHGHRPAR